MTAGFQEVQIFEENVNTVMHRALRAADGLRVILKSSRSFYPSATERRRLQYEHELLSSISADGVVRVLGLQHGERGPVLVMADFGGVSLRTLLPPSGLPLERFFGLAAGLSRAVQALHRGGVIHKNINPSSILVDPEGSACQLIDFSEATRLSRERPAASASSQLGARLVYVSPEQTGRLNRTVDWRSDLYSLGVVFYEMLTGRPPFVADDSIALVHRHIAVSPIDPRELRSDIPRCLSHLVLTLLAKSAEDRYQSAAGLLEDLVRCEDAWKKGNADQLECHWTHFADRFELAQGIYGRNDKVAELGKVYDKVEAGSVCLVTVTGAAGIGKSALVHEFAPSVLQRGGHFITGKFDQFQSDIPYASLVEGIRELIRGIIAQGTAGVHRWKRRLLDRIGPNLQLIERSLPELRLLVGELPAVPDLGTAEATNRAVLVALRFIQAFADEAHPLVLFLDDVQWADVASWELIAKLLTSPQSNHLMVIAAHRSTDSEASAPIAQLNELVAERERVVAIELEPISVHDIAALLGRSAGLDPASCRRAAEHVLLWTGGNPFVVRQMLAFLVERGALTIDQRDGGFDVNLSRLASVGVPADIAELMSTRLNSLSEPSLAILELAACIGNRFDIGALALVTQRTDADIAAALAPAIDAGLVISVSSWSDVPEHPGAIESRSTLSCRFSHDRVQQVAYARMPPAERTRTHLKLGRALLQQKLTEPDLYQVIRHLNLAIERIDDAGERENLARLNLKAGEQAKKAAALASAKSWLGVGRSLLAADCWSSQYELALALHQAALDVAALTADGEQVEALGAVIAAHARQLLDRVPIFEAKVQCSVAQGRPDRALAYAREALALLGVALPVSPGALRVGWSFARTILALRGRSVDDLASLPEMRDPEKLAAMRVLMRGTSAAYITDPNAFALIVLQMVNLSLTHGNCAESAFGYMTFGVLLSGALGQVERAASFGAFSLKLAERFGASALEAKLIVSYYVTLEPWRHHLALTLEPFQDAYRAGLETGDVEYACHAAMYYSNYLLWVGEPLDSVHAAQRRYLEAIDAYRSEFHADYARMFHQLVSILRDETARTDLAGLVFDEHTGVAKLSRGSNKTSMFVLWHCKTVLSYLLGKPAEAARHAAQARKFALSVQGSINPALNIFYEALALLGSWSEMGWWRRWLARLRIAVSVRHLSRWAARAPMNYAHKRDLVLAEHARVNGHHAEAVRLYDRAARQAHDSGYVQDMALTHERFAEHLFGLGADGEALHQLGEAIKGWQRWGARSKVGILLRHRADAHARLGITEADSEREPVVEPEAVSFDLASVIKASNALSEIIVLDRLVERLLLILMENAGAQEGALFLMQGAELVLRARANLTQRGIEVALFDPDGAATRADEGLAAQSIVQFVARSRQAVILDDASRDSVYGSDPRVRRCAVRSVLCMPLVNRGRLSGVAYFENNSISHAFTPQRRQTVEVVASHAVNSLRNAELYGEVQDSERGLRRVNDSLARFVPSQFLASLGHSQVTEVKLGDNVRKEMSILFSDVRNFASLVEMMSAEEHIAFINEYLSFMDPAIVECGGFVDSYIGDAIMALFDGSADAAVRAGIQMSRMLEALNAKRRDSGLLPMRMGVGINTGVITLGTIGGPNRIKCGVIGDPVNVASRVESLTKAFGAFLLISDATYERLEDPGRYAIRLVDRVRVKGRQQPITLYEVLDAEVAAVRDEKVALRAHFNQAVALYYDRQFKEAGKLFGHCISVCPDDLASRRFVATCWELSDKGVPDGWTGVRDLDHK